MNSEISTFQFYSLCVISALAWSALPVAVVLGGSSESVWFQICAVSLGYSLFFFIWLKINQPGLASIEGIKNAIKEISEHKGLLLAQRCGLPCFLLAAAYTDPAVAAVIVETWIMWYVAIELKKSEHHISMADKLKTSGLLCMGIIGVAGVTYSQYGTIALGVGWGGAIVVTICAALQGHNVRTSLQHGEKISDKINEGNAVGGSVLAVGVASSLIFVVSSCVHIGLSVSGSVSLLPSAVQMLWSLPVWLIVAPYALLSARKMNHIRNNSHVGANLIYHIAAPMALLWLWAAGTEIHYPQAMIAGTALIVLSAFLANFRKTAIG